MRIRTCIESLRLRRAARGDAIAGTMRASRHTVALLRTPAGASTRRAVRKAAAFAAIVIATLLALNAFVSADDDLHDTNRASAASGDCSARYAALLDLAELARRDGKSSEVVVRGLSERGGAMSGCLPVARGGRVPQ